MRKGLLLAAALFMLSLAGCLGPALPAPFLPSTPLPKPVESLSLDLTPRTYPTVDGSTSAHPLQVLLACRLLDVPCDWQEGWLLDKTRRIGPELGSESSPEVVERIFQIQHSGTHGAYVNLIARDADLILVARLPSEDELQLAGKRGISLDATPVALDAFVFLVHVDNRVQTLDRETVRRIYTGEFTRWPQVGSDAGPPGAVGAEIHPYQRNRNSGSQELMEALVMQGASMLDAPDMLLESMLGPINAIGDDPLGIGYSVYYYAVFINPGVKIKLIGVDGIVPSSDTIANRSYPLTTEVYAVIRGNEPRRSKATLLRDWLLTREGQAVVEESGYVPVY